MRHGSWRNAFGYRVTTPGRAIVISGDAAPDEAPEQYTEGADILIHQVYPVEGCRRREPQWQKYRNTNHTSTHEFVMADDLDVDQAARHQPGRLCP